MPTKTILLSAALGGLALFIWGGLSHAVLPFYNSTLQRFTDEKAMTQAILTNAPRSGVYFMPYEPQLPASATAEEKTEAKDAMMKQMSEGPFVFASVRVGQMGWLSGYLAVQLLTDVFTALLVTLLLWNARHLSFRSRVLFVEGVALTIICAGNLPYWNWYAFSTGFTIAEAFDQIVGLFFAGMVIARVIPSGN